MKTTMNDGKLVIALSGRLDASNANDIEAEIMAAVAGHESDKICFDFEELEYISSAGLRVLMKLQKKSAQRIDIINVSRDVYEIFDTTGFTDMFNVKKAYRKISVDGLEIIGTGFFGTVYRLDRETIVKVYKGQDSIPMIENEKKMAQKAFLAGIPTAISYDIVKVGEDYGSVFELIDSQTFNEMAKNEEEPLEDVMRRYTDLLKKVHQTVMEPGELPSFKERFLDYLEVIKKHLKDEHYEGLKKLLSAMPDENTVVHGDMQMKNVMSSADEAMLIDMDTIGLGNPVFDLAALFVTYQEFSEDDPDNPMYFLQMPNEKVDRIWELIIQYYFDFKDDKERCDTMTKIRLVAGIRFLFILETTDLKNSDLGRRRIEHTIEHFDELLGTVDSLEI
ncbi:MAG: anti-sigma factor antagonist [Lachnospiraceae bacterium]|nr:anti-sigma factor antagonist [Lachnospiraceae bacterium]